MPDYWSTFRPRQGVPLFNAFVGGELYIHTGNLPPRNALYSMVKTYFDILNHLGASHKCDGRKKGRTDRQTDRQTLS